MINSFLGNERILEALLSSEKTDALLSPSVKRLARWFGAIAISLFGYPLSISARTRAHDILRMISLIPKGSLIDIGCSFGGAQTFELARRLAPNTVLGLDIDEESIKVARQINEVLRLDNLKFEVGDILTWKQGDTARFDIAFTSETLEHIEIDAAAMANIARLVRPGGWIVVSVPYAENPVEHEKPEAAFDATEGTNCAELFKGGYHWRSGYNEDTLGTLLNSASLEVVSFAHTQTFSILPSGPFWFPVSYPLSRLASPYWGTTRKLNVLARKAN